MNTSDVASVAPDAPANTKIEKIGRRTLPELAGIRKLIFDRSREREVTLADLSRAVRKNNAYMHQFIYKGTPRRLDEETRIVLGGMLDLSPDQLREGQRIQLTSEASTCAHKPRRAETMGGNIPLFRESDIIDTRKASSWVPSMPTARGLAAFALWIELPRGRLAPGDMVFASPDQPIRRADIVALLAGKTILCIGEVHHVSAESIAVERFSESVEYARNEVQIFKVIGAAYP